MDTGQGAEKVVQKVEEAGSEQHRQDRPSEASIFGRTAAEEAGK